MQNKHFQKQQPKLRMEAWLRSTLCGLAVGFGANFLASAVLWLTSIDGLWLSIGVLVVATLVATPIFYYKRYRPTDVSAAKRIDRLGLEERLITMVEFQNEDSYIARIQREGAQTTLSAVDNKQLKIIISKAIAIAVSVCFVLGAGMTTINVLAEAGILKGGDELIDDFVEEQTTVYVTISYVIEEGGIIEGDEEQVIVISTDGTAVTAVADEGYMFKCWSDGYAYPTRTDEQVTEDVVYVAEFTEIEDGEGNGEGDGEGEGEGDGDEASDAPGEEGQGEGDGNGENDGPPNESQGAGGQWKPNNGFIDGETNYRDVLDEYKDAADETVEDSDSELSEEEKELIKKYLGIV